MIARRYCERLVVERREPVAQQRRRPIGDDRGESARRGVDPAPEDRVLQTSAVSGTGTVSAGRVSICGIAARCARLRLTQRQQDGVG